MYTMTDLQIRAQKAISENPQTKEYGIEALDDNGIFTLKGNVPSHKVKETAESVLREVHGLAGVINELDITTAEQTELIKTVMGTMKLNE